MLGLIAKDRSQTGTLGYSISRPNPEDRPQLPMHPPTIHHRVDMSGHGPWAAGKSR